MREIINTTTVYSYQELGDDAQERAYQAYVDSEVDHGFNWANEAMDSLRAFAKYFDVTIRDWEIYWDGTGPSSVTFDGGITNYNPKEERGNHFYDDFDDGETSLINMEKSRRERELRTLINGLGSYDPNTLKGSGECRLTGMCFDEFLADGIRHAFFEGERDANELLKSAFESWLKLCQDEFEYQLSHEAFLEWVESNQPEYLTNGEEYYGSE